MIVLRTLSKYSYEDGKERSRQQDDGGHIDDKKDPNDDDPMVSYPVSLAFTVISLTSGCAGLVEAPPGRQGQEGQVGQGQEGQVGQAGQR